MIHTQFIRNRQGDTIDSMSDFNPEEARQKRFRYMTETPVPKLVMELSVPTIISMMVSGLYNMADTFFVGRISTQATAAVGVVFSVMAFIQAVGFFCGHGSGNYLSRMLGAGRMKEANEMAATGFALAFLLGICLMASGLLFLKPLSVLLGATPTILKDTQDYMRIILIGAPFMCAELVINNQLRFQGAAVYSMIGLVSGAVINIGLDPLLMFTFGMGVAGAALATIISQFIGFCILWIGSCRGANLRIRFSNIRFTRHYLLQIMNGGAPSLFRQGLGSVSTIILNTTAGAVGGDAVIAAMSVVTRVMMLAISALIGFGQGFQPVCAFNYGAKLYERVHRAFIFCVKYGTVFLAAVSVPAILFAPQVIAFFRSDPEVISVGTAALRFQMLFFCLNAFSVMANMMLQSIGMGMRASILASARSGLFFIPLILVLSPLLGIRGIEMTQMCADIFTFIVSLPMTLPVLKNMKEQKQRPE